MRTSRAVAECEVKIAGVQEARLGRPHAIPLPTGGHAIARRRRLPSDIGPNGACRESGHAAKLQVYMSGRTEEGIRCQKPIG